MKVWTRRLFGVVCLNVLLAVGSGACSSSQEEDENLENSEQQEQQQGQQDEQEEQQQGAQQQEAEEGNENFNAENMEVGENNLADQGAQENAGENDLQEIISEMDQGNGQANAAANPMNQDQQMQVNDQSQSQGQENVAMAADQGMQEAVNASVDTSTTSAGGVVGGAQGQAAGQGLPELGSKMPYVVHSGDTLAKISAKIYGTPGRWREISALSGLENPNAIYPGDVVYYQLTQEAVAFAQASVNAIRQEVVVQQGDTLATIAKRALGSGRFWKSIWRENDHIVNPDQLVVGQTIFYVTDEALSAAVDHAKETLRNVNVAQSSAIDLNDNTNADQTTADFEFQSEDLNLLVKTNIYAVATNS